MDQLKISLFDPLQINVNDQPVSDFRTQKVLALLVYLAAEPEKAHRRDVLMTLLWPGMPDASGRANLRQVLFLLRQAISAFAVEVNEAPLLIANRHTIQLNPDGAVFIDAVQFEMLLSRTQSHDHLDLLTCHACREDLVAATALYTGNFLANFYLDDSNAFEEWAEIERQMYQRKMLDALETLTTIAMRQQAFAEARLFVERQLEIDVLRESAYQQLMEILARDGQRNEALSVYEKCRRLLDEELAMAPSKRTTRLYEKILAGDLQLDTTQEQGVRGYDLQDEIGAGAHGVIHRALQPAIGREVAVKIINRRYANDPTFIRRFEAEAQTIARLEHPHIVPLYDYWRDPDGAYLVMRLLRGGNLLTTLEKGPWPLERTQKLLDQITPALAAAHQQGIVHRDIKPANILFDESGNAYLSDFGIAKDLQNDPQMTMEGGILGTPDYLSPEQLQEEPVSAQSDIYSMGAVLYEMLTGEKPFPDRPLVKLIQDHLVTPIPSVGESRPDLPAQLDAVIQKATAKIPSDRFADVRSLAEAFRDSVEGRPVTLADFEPAPADADISNPYKGLRAFQEADAVDFFGRDNLTHQLVERLRDSRFLAVVGPSGSGKSSVVKAGVLPELRQGAIRGSENWFVAEMVPGTHPLEELELALWPVAVDPPPSLVEPMQRDPRGMLRTIRRILPNEEGAQLLLVIDQFEELWSLTSKERRGHFLDSLLAALDAPHSPLRVIVTLRADFYDRPLQVPPVAEYFKQQTALVLPLNHDELTWAIREPARRVGVEFVEDVLPAIVAEVHDQPGALPLLQYALTEMFDAREGNQIQQSAIDKVGGVLGALPRRADEIFKDLSDPDKIAARQIFLRLITLGEGAEDTRRRVLLSEMETLHLKTPPEKILQTPIPNIESPILQILNRFGDARLLTFDHDPLTRQPTVEVAHEALLREWGHLRSWLAESRDDIRLQRLLAAAVSEWEQSEQNHGFLLRGARLTQYEMWAVKSSIALTAEEQSFLNLSGEARQQREAEEAARLQRELETAQQLAETEHRRAEEQASAAVNLRKRAVYLSAALAAAAILAIAAVFAGFRATENAEVARFNETQAQSLALTADARQALLSGDLDLALALAVAAVDIDQPPAIAVRTLNEIASAPGTRALYESGAGPIDSLTMKAHGFSFITLSDFADGTMIEWDSTSGERKNEFKVDEEGLGIASHAILSDSTRLVVGYKNGAVALWDLGTGERLQSFEGLHTWVTDVIPSADSKAIVAIADFDSFASGTDGMRVIAWDIESGQEIYRLEAPGEWMTIVAVSQDSKTALIGLTTYDAENLVPDGVVRLLYVDLKTGEILAEPAHPLAGPIFIADLAIHPAGNQAAAVVLDLDENGDLVPVSSTGLLISLPDGAVFGEVGFRQDTSPPLMYTPDGSQLIVGLNSYFLLLDAATGEIVRYLGSENVGHYGQLNGDSVVITEDGSSLFSGSDANDLIWWDVQAGEIKQRLLGHSGPITGIGIGRNGQGVISASSDGSLRFWDLALGGGLDAQTAFQRFEGHKHDWVPDVALSPDGSLAVSIEWSEYDDWGSDPVERAAILWDTQTLEVIHRLPGDFFQVEFLPDGRTVVLGGAVDQRSRETAEILVVLWDMESGEVRSQLNPGVAGEQLWDMDISPDGKYVLFGTSAGDVYLYDLETLTQAMRFTHTVEDRPAVRIQAVGFSPDGRTALSGSDQGDLLLWDLETGELIRRYAYQADITDVAFSKDGSRFLTTAFDQTVVLWDVESGDVIRTFNGHTERVFSVAFTPDESQVISTSGDGMLILWDVATGEALRTFSEHADIIVQRVVLSPDGQLAYSAGQDGRVIIRSIGAVPVEDVLAFIRENRVLRELTCEQKEQYRVGVGCEGE